MEGLFIIRVFCMRVFFYSVKGFLALDLDTRHILRDHLCKSGFCVSKELNLQIAAFLYQASHDDLP